jgi:hypothetical protein
MLNEVRPQKTGAPSIDDSSRVSVIGRTSSALSFHIQQSAHSVDQFLDFERLLHEVVGTGFAEILDLVGFNHTANADDFDIVHTFVRANSLANFFAIDVWQHDIQDNDVGLVFLDHHPRIESIVGDAHLKPTVGVKHVTNHFDQFLVVVHDQRFAFAAFQGIANQFDQILVVVDNENFSPSAIEGIGRNAVVSHEGVQLLSRDTTKAAPWYAKSLKLTGVKTTDYRLLANLANLGRFASGENSLHDGTTSLLSRWFVGYNKPRGCLRAIAEQEGERGLSLTVSDP